MSKPVNWLTRGKSGRRTLVCALAPYLTGTTKPGGRGGLCLQLLLELGPRLLRQLAFEVCSENLAPRAVDRVNLAPFLLPGRVAGFSIDPSQSLDVGGLLSPVVPSSLGELEIFQKKVHDLNFAGGCPNDDASWGSLIV